MPPPTETESAPWECTDENFDAFWERIHSSYGGWVKQVYRIPDEQIQMRGLTKHREKQGRGNFGDAYLTRDNMAELREELADALMYLYLETLKNVHDDMDPEWDMVLSIANDLLSAQRKLPLLARKHRGAP